VRLLAWSLIILVLSPFLVAASANAAQWIQNEYIQRTALRVAKEKLAKSRCKLAFAKHLPEYGQDLDLLSTFESIKIQRVEWILTNPLARGAVNCDISKDTMIVSDGYAGWTGVENTAETIIHEYAHLLRCESIIKECQGSQANCAPMYRVQEERRAYKIAQICMPS
jgi:hypothetical protein